MLSIWDVANLHLRDLAVYEPGKPIEETARELGVNPNNIIKLASNENPLGPSPKAARAIERALESANLYPDGGGYYLREALAAKLGLTRDHIILGSGSNEVIEFIGHAFLACGDSIVTAEHAFIVYKLVAAVFGAATIEVAGPGFSHDLDTIIGAITSKTRVIFIANPNNPTGTLAGQKEIDRFMERLPEKVVAVFDEAYFEYLDEPPDTLKFVRANRNVVVLRTFSKIYGLAGLRVGYAIARPELIRVLQKARQPFNVSSVGQIGALAGLDDQEHLDETKRITDEGRDFLQAQFKSMGLSFIPSAANFILVNVGDGVSIFTKLLQQQVIIRAMNGYKLPEWVRISIGTMEENRRCVAALRQVMQTTTV